MSPAPSTGINGPQHRRRGGSARHCPGIQGRQDPSPFLSRLRTQLSTSLLEQRSEGNLVTLNRSRLHGSLPSGAIESHLSSITPEAMTVICDDRCVLNPWQWCDADDDVVGDFLAATVQGLIEAGGWIHPDARIVARVGEIHIECPADEGTPLIRVPAAAMLPVTRVRWDSHHDELSMLGLDDWPEGADLSLLLTQVGLHNSCGKIPRLSASHPSACPSLSDEVIAAVRALRPSFRTRAMSPTEIFWTTRTFRLPVFDPVAEPVALPVIDLMNHNPGGATGQWHDGSFTVTVHHPTGTAECFLDYGMNRDALDTAVVYGFADTATTTAHSAPVTITSDDAGTITVLDHGRSPDGGLLPLHCQKSGDTWTFNRFTFGAREALIDLAIATGQPREWCDAVVSAIAQANLDLIDALGEMLGQPPGDSTHIVLAAAVQQQRAILMSHVS